MKIFYFLDTEFNGFGGELLSLGLVREDGKGLYITYDTSGMQIVEWVRDNVLPIMELETVPADTVCQYNLTQKEGAAEIRKFLSDDPQKVPVIVADWPDDISYFCKAVMTGPGMMASLGGRVVFDYIDVDSWFERRWLHGDMPAEAVQHNAYWDARALREVFTHDSR